MAKLNIDLFHFQPTQLIGISLINSQVYNYFLIFPENLINKTAILNEVNMEYNLILKELDVILNNKISGDKEINLEFFNNSLDTLIMINKSRLEFLVYVNDV